MSVILLLIIIFVVCCGGGYWGFNAYHPGWGAPGGLGLLLIVLLIVWLTGGFNRRVP